MKTNNIFLCSYFAKVADEFYLNFTNVGKKVCFVDTAAKFEQVNFYVKDAKEAFLELGFDPIMADISMLSHDEFTKTLAKSDILYFSGGNTFYLMSEIYKNNLFSCIYDFLNKGGVYVGESAGAIIASPDIKYISLMDENIVNLEQLSALNLVDFYTLPHYKEEPFTDICDEILSKFKKIKAINNSQFILGIYSSL